MGTPRDRINFGATWDVGTWSFSGIVNYRGPMDNKFEAKDTTCAQTFANGADAPSGCKISSFTTLDASFRWKIRPNTELSGSVQNLLDRKPPFDPLTYGAIGYNPLDYSGAVGRYFTVGLRHKF